MRYLYYMTVIFSLGFAQMALAQDANPSTPSPAAPEREGDWLYQCENADEQSTCEALYIADITVKDKQLPLFRFSLSKTQKDQDYAILYFPYSVDFYLGAPPTIYVDGRRVDDIPWVNCNATGCWAHKVLPSKTVRRMKRGLKGVMRIVLLDGRNLDVNFSLTGITATLKKLN